MKGHKVALGGSYSGDSGELFRRLTHDDILQCSQVGREITLQVKSEKVDEIIKALNRLGVQNISILEWRKCGTTLAGSGCSSDKGEILNVSLIPSALGGGLRPLSVTQKTHVDRRLCLLYTSPSPRDS